MGRALLDAIVAFLFCVLVAIPAALVGRLAAHAGLVATHPWWHWALLPLGALAFAAAMLATAFILRLLLPRVEPGRYPFPYDRRSVTWLLHFSLQRLLYLPVWRHFLFAFSTLRWLLLRALGGRVAFDMDTSSDVLLLDPPLVTIQSGSMIGAGSSLSGHYIEQGMLLLGRVLVERGVQISSGVQIGPGTTIGEHATIGPDCRLPADITIGPFAYLGAACHVSPGVRIGANAVLGHQVGLTPGVIVGEGAVIATGTRVPRGVVIPDGAHYPPDARDERT
jgi:acetyltransferase-like isoleucine patch superfamily enzyme